MISTMYKKFLVCLVIINNYFMFGELVFFGQGYEVFSRKYRKYFLVA